MLIQPSDSLPCPTAPSVEPTVPATAAAPELASPVGSAIGPVADSLEGVAAWGSQAAALPPLTIAPARVVRGWQAVAQGAAELARLGDRFLVVGGERSLAVAWPQLAALAADRGWALARGTCGECSEATLARLQTQAIEHRATGVIGVGGGKALDTAKLLAHQLKRPVATIPTSAATCAAWSALSNVYSEAGAFLYDVPLDRCPDLLILDYGLVVTAPPHTLVAGIGDAIAKWYEASVSSGQASQSTIIAAVQQARVLRDWLLQHSAAAIASPGSAVWQEAVDASVLLAGTIGGLGGAQCRTVAAHAVHNGLTHVVASHGTLHGDKVAFGILVQLRLEELVQGSHLAAIARSQLLTFYEALGLPKRLADLGLGHMTIADLQRAADIACDERSDIHHLPFPVSAGLVMAAMVSTTAPGPIGRSGLAEPTDAAAIAPPWSH